jgi:fused signal recognition particle receptor
VVQELGLPICYVGVGEDLDDLEVFDPELFVDGLLENPHAEAA